jgi:hypothetical protein
MCIEVMEQSQIRRRWIVFILISNASFLGYLYYYQSPGGLIMGLPVTWVVLLGIMLVVFAINSTFAWYYLEKPNLREVFGGAADQGSDR